MLAQILNKLLCPKISNQNITKIYDICRNIFNIFYILKSSGNTSYCLCLSFMLLYIYYILHSQTENDRTKPGFY